ncbi:LysE family translocator [Cohaesibacter celericrescens]|uniref:LysE family translocator n=1 Tax=Cohaesibacter celericrescens TaxID=2067669 RepID=A0A2N5XSL3_9HYPH|nr:LysE family translocator [Cohaesibacter celericrescens]PLW77408.1 LysE family translocator [Cohaesibacter celericrescens]
MTIEIWLLFVALSILPAFSPGPGLLLTLSNSIRFGSRITLWSAFGNTLGMALMGLMVTFGLAALMAASTTAFFGLKIIGGLYLIWLGVKTWRDRTNLIESNTEIRHPGQARLFFTGVGIALTNPKALAVQLSIIPPFLSHPDTIYQDGTILSFTYAGVCLISHVTVALLSGRLRVFFTSPRRMQYLRRTLGATFMGFGVALAAATR